MILLQMAILCFCPPDTWYGYFFRMSEIPNLVVISFTLLSISVAFTFCIVKAIAIFSYAVNVSNKLKSWKTKPNCSLLNLFNLFPFSLVISSPFIIICPDVTLSIVEIVFKSVVFPEPLAPIIPTNSFLLTSKLILSIAFVSITLLP